MRSFTVWVNEIKSNTQQAPTYSIALSPSSRNGGPASTKFYSAKDKLVEDLRQRLGFSDEKIERYFASDDKKETFYNQFLSDENSIALGWRSDL